MRNAVTPVATAARLTPARAIIYGALVVGALDALDAIVFFGLRGVRPGRIFQSIAAGLLGREAFNGGAPIIALGVVLHFVIAGGIVATYVAASRFLRVLTRHPIVCGILYGVVAYLVMNLIVIPLSAAGRAPLRWPVVINGLMIHMFGVGLPASLFARAVAWRGPDRSTD